MTAQADKLRMHRPAVAEALSSVVGWLTGEARHLESPGLLLEGLCERLCAHGLPLARASLSLFILHPLLHGRSYRWREGQAHSVLTHPHGSQVLPGYAQSPFRALREAGVARLHRRLVAPAPAEDFPMMAELRAEGLTDYLALAVCFGDGTRHGLSWATAAPGGFTDAELAVLEGLHPVLQLVVELLSKRDMTAVLLDTYLGRDAGRRVLQGQVKRGDGETTSAVICLCDLRGFTTLSERLPRDEVLELLNAYFATVVGAFHSQGAEVLKFMGDAVLAIFRMEEGARVEEGCAAAVRTMREAVAAATRDNEERRRRGLATYDFGAALHVGDVMYGNIGAPDRLDFTVIGPAVNLASRIAGQCGELGEAVLLSEAFAAHYPAGRELGERTLKGVARPVRLFALEWEGASHVLAFPTRAPYRTVSS